MGYYTKFNLDVVQGIFEDDPEDVLNNIHSQREDHYKYGFFDDKIKWYDHDQDMKEFSMIYPDVVFALSGEGEINNDMWIKYYKNGKVQEWKARIVFDKYDETKLK